MSNSEIPEDCKILLYEFEQRASEAHVLGGGDELAFDEIVDPRDLRGRLISAIEIEMKA